MTFRTIYVKVVLSNLVFNNGNGTKTMFNYTVQHIFWFGIFFNCC